MLVVASDRVSAFDHVLEPGIPGKGALLTSLSMWWFDQLADVPNHLAGDAPAEVADRAMLVRSLDMLPIECVVRGYITGSGWVEYQQSGHGVRHRTACRTRQRRPPARADLHPRIQGAARRARREHLVREVRRPGRRDSCRRAARRLARDLLPRRAHRGGQGADPRRHEVRVRHRRRGRAAPRRRSAHERLVALLGSRRVAERLHARRAHGELRQADRARLALRELGPRARRRSEWSWGGRAGHAAGSCPPTSSTARSPGTRSCSPASAPETPPTAPAGERPGVPLMRPPRGSARRPRRRRRSSPRG